MEKKTEMTREDMINELDKVMNDLYAKVGADSYVWRCRLYDIKEALRKNQIPLPSPLSATAEGKMHTKGLSQLLRDVLIFFHPGGRFMSDENGVRYYREDIAEKFAALAVAEATKELLKQRDELRETLKKISNIIPNATYCLAREAVAQVAEAAIKSTDG